MPVYLYRREDGTTFEYKQKFSDDPLKTDPESGQSVVRLVQPTGVIFKGSGFYINDSKGASKKSLSSPSNGNGNGTSSESNGSSGDSASSDTTSSPTSESKSTETKSETKSEKKSDSSKVAS